MFHMNHITYLMETIPLCDIIEVYNIYLRLYTTIFHNSVWRHVSVAHATETCRHALNKSCSYSLLWNIVVYRRK